jgi:hypothetical protein
MPVIWGRSQAKLLKIGIEQGDKPDRIEMPHEYRFSGGGLFEPKPGRRIYLAVKAAMSLQAQRCPLCRWKRKIGTKALYIGYGPQSDLALSAAKRCAPHNHSSSIF